MEMERDNFFWDATIEQVKKGYVEEEECFTCLICGEKFIKGKIYNVDSEFFDSEKTTEIHVKNNHGSMLYYILNMNKNFTGITEVQREILLNFSTGKSDKEIAMEMGIATSTIRNHRYKLREKEKQAKLFLAMMQLLPSGTEKKISELDNNNLCEIHKTATMIDHRYNITEEEKMNVIKNNFDSNGALKTYPVKEKKKVIILEEIIKNFNKGKFYTEKDINKILKRIYEDYATLRRALVEYGFIDRTDDCSKYWVKE
ncbi:DUF2087 domain-containing protein [Hathewaya histolytica]|uniref:DUF2087 domain-containing protein n=1 Tax=Hathewaya histolytica TaxID=1498 RepID=UPI003B66C107